jgi:hypothetical protein
MEGLDAAGGILEKLLPGVSLPVLMTAVLPGLTVGLALYPFTTGKLRDFLSLDLQKGWYQLVIAALLIVMLGALISTLNGQFYNVLSGHVWPSRFFNLVRDCRQKRINRLYRKIDAEKPTNAEGKKVKSSPRSNKIWSILRDYPIDPETGKRHATSPTLLGNIIEGYEQYPNLRYGMSSAFYWHRLWLMVDKDQKEEVAKTWAVADGLLNLSAVSFLAGFLWLGAYLGAKVGLLGLHWLPIKGSSITSTVAIAGWFGLGFFLYWLSLPFHRQNGNLFKSLFDLYRDRLTKMTSLSPREEELWKGTWAYLQDFRISCPFCGGHTIPAVRKEVCVKCGKHSPGSLAVFKRSGKFV